MDSDILQSEQWLRFVAWLEDNARRVIAVSAVVIGVGVVAAFFLWQGAQKQRRASEALTFLLSQPQAPTSEALLVLSEERAGTLAARRARLFAAGGLYEEGRYEEARAEFQQLLTDSPVSPLTPQARFGVAACDEALGNLDAAASGYKAIVNTPANGSAIPLARFALGNLYARQGQVDLAREQYEALTRAQGTALAQNARLLLADLPQPDAEVVPEPAVTPDLP